MSKLPFGVMPGHWGLVGRTREIAKAEYELEPGYDLDVRILEIKKDDYEPAVYEKKFLALSFKWKKLDESQYHRELANRIEDPKQKGLALLELDYREGKLDDREYSKQTATLNDEPWVTVINMDFGGKSALEGSFELDWNDQFVEKLRAEGYQAPTPDVIVNQWFMEVCRNVAMEEFDGTGDFTADSAANLDAVKRWNSEPLPQGRKGHK